MSRKRGMPLTDEGDATVAAPAAPVARNQRREDMADIARRCAMKSSAWRGAAYAWQWQQPTHALFAPLPLAAVLPILPILTREEMQGTIMCT
jgi:hypothetical protein